MPKIRNLFALFLLLGLVFAELLPAINNFEPQAANSQSRLSEEDRDLLASLLQGNNELPTVSTDLTFLDIYLPDNPASISQDLLRSSDLVYNSFPSLDSYTQTEPTSETTTLPAESLLNPSDILQNVLPPIGTPLYYAYQDGGRAWYQNQDNVLVIFDDETIRSFNKSTGAANTWLQKELAYPPIEDSTAIQNYQTNYNAKQVAETSTWVLMEFPSGGVLKVMKPSYSASNQGGTFSNNLPTVLPGYSN